MSIERDYTIEELAASGGVVSVSVRCPFCRGYSFVVVDKEGWDKFEDGAFVQDAFPWLNSDDREVLVSGVCRPCWSMMMEDEDD